MSKKIEKLVRLNSLVRADQMQFIKDTAEKEHLSHGEVCRKIIEYYVLNHK